MPRQRRSGCAGLLGFILLLCAVVAMFNWPAFVDAKGVHTSGVLSEKRETVKIEFGDWFRHFEIIGEFAVPGLPLKRHAVCDVSEATYDSLHTGSVIAVAYLPDLLNQPFLPATHLSPCTSWDSVNINPSFTRKLLLALAALLLILFFWRVLRIRLIAFLLLPWACLMFAAVALPHTEPEPAQPLPTTATVESITTVSTVMEGQDSEGIPLQHPYQVVRLKFLPPGMDAPVTAIDKIDSGSIPGLHAGQNAAIVYDASRPRVARLEGGTRSFPGHALMTVVLASLAFFVFLSIVALAGWLLHQVARGASRNPLVRAAKANAAFRRRGRRF